jgi:transposase
MHSRSYVRLHGHFNMPKVPADAVRIELDATTLAMLLDGIDVKYVRRPTTWTPPASLPSR